MLKCELGLTCKRIIILAFTLLCYYTLYLFKQVFQLQSLKLRWYCSYFSLILFIYLPICTELQSHPRAFFLLQCTNLLSQHTLYGTAIIAIESALPVYLCRTNIEQKYCSLFQYWDGHIYTRILRNINKELNQYILFHLFTFNVHGNIYITH